MTLLAWNLQRQSQGGRWEKGILSRGKVSAVKDKALGTTGSNDANTPEVGYCVSPAKVGWLIWRVKITRQNLYDVKCYGLFAATTLLGDWLRPCCRAGSPTSQLLWLAPGQAEVAQKSFPAIFVCLSSPKANKTFWKRSIGIAMLLPAKQRVWLKQNTWSLGTGWKTNRGEWRRRVDIQRKYSMLQLTVWWKCPAEF